MNSLILDCSAGMCVYLEKDNEIFSMVDFNQKKHTDELLKVLDELLKKANLKIGSIDNLCVCVGPGSFTGIRVAISLAKGLAVVNNFKIFVLSNFDIYDVASDSKNVIVLEGFSDNVYVRKFNENLPIDSCEKLADLKAWLAKNEGMKIFAQNEKMQNMLKNYEIQSNIARNVTILKFNKKINSGENILTEQINPIYLRSSQAEIERQKKLLGQK